MYINLSSNEIIVNMFNNFPVLIAGEKYINMMLKIQNVSFNESN